MRQPQRLWSDPLLTHHGVAEVMGVEPTLDQEARRATILKSVRRLCEDVVCQSRVESHGIAPNWFQNWFQAFWVSAPTEDREIEWSRLANEWLGRNYLPILDCANGCQSSLTMGGAADASSVSAGPEVPEGT
jgi:hypothetical protein